jgi:hypothetical protein
VVARTDECVVAVTDATAYPTGFEFKLVVRSRRGPDAEFDPFEMDPLQFHHPLMWRRMKSAFERGELPPELFRFGIAFADGSKATTLGGHPLGHDPREKPTRPVLRPRGGGGGGGDWNQEYWMWPLPPEGRLAFVCEWPAKGIELTRREIDAGVIRAAAEQAEVLWEESGGRRAWSGYGTMYAIGRPDVAEDVEEEPT